MDRLSIEDSRKFENKLKHFWRQRLKGSGKILADQFYNYVRFSYKARGVNIGYSPTSVAQTMMIILANLAHLLNEEKLISFLKMS